MKAKVRRTSDGTKGAIIPPTRENMEQTPKPTFLLENKAKNNMNRNKKRKSSIPTLMETSKLCSLSHTVKVSLTVA